MTEAVVTRVLEALHTVSRAFPVSPFSTANLRATRWLLRRPEGLSSRVLHASHKFHHLQRRHARYLAPQRADTSDVAVRYQRRVLMVRVFRGNLLILCTITWVASPVSGARSPLHLPKAPCCSSQLPPQKAMLISQPPTAGHPDVASSTSSRFSTPETFAANRHCTWHQPEEAAIGFSGPREEVLRQQW